MAGRGVNAAYARKTVSYLREILEFIVITAQYYRATNRVNARPSQRGLTSLWPSARLHPDNEASLLTAAWSHRPSAKAPAVVFFDNSSHRARNIF